MTWAILGYDRLAYLRWCLRCLKARTLFGSESFVAVEHERYQALFVHAPRKGVARWQAGNVEVAPDHQVGNVCENVPHICAVPGDSWLLLHELLHGWS